MGRHSKRQPVHLQSAALGELLGGPAPAALQTEGSWGMQELEQVEAAELVQPLPQSRELPPARAASPPSPPAMSEAPAADYTRRNAARLGGDGVAGIFGGAGEEGEMHMHKEPVGLPT